MKRIILFIFTIFIINSTLFSQTWTELTSGVSVVLYSVSAPDENNVWVCGSAGTILKTTNGGTNWTNVTGSPIPVTLPLVNIFGVDANIALVTGTSGGSTFVYRTSNGGNTWTMVFTQPGGFIDAIWMGNAAAGFMYGDAVSSSPRWSLWGTVTGGVTWDSTSFYLPQTNFELGYSNAFFFDPVTQAVWFGTNNTRIYKSTNLMFWSTQSISPQNRSTALWFNSGTNGMCGGNEMMFTSNSGATWSPTTGIMPGIDDVTGITGITSNWWVTRLASMIYFSGNDGVTWNPQYTAPAGKYYHLTKSRSGVPTLFGVRNIGGITKGTGLLVGINNTSGEIPANYNLNQNFPNPFNPTTSIKFDVPKSSGIVSLIVYDALGREVDVLVNENLSAGSYEVNFNAASISSGVYYYTLKAGGFIQTKKMSLIK